MMTPSFRSHIIQFLRNQSHRERVEIPNQFTPSSEGSRGLPLGGIHQLHHVAESRTAVADKVVVLLSGEKVCDLL